MCVKKFIFSKFGGLQAYSQQLYYQMNSFTGIFRQHFKLSPCSPMFWLKPPPTPSNFEEPPHVRNSCGKPWVCESCSWSVVMCWCAAINCNNKTKNLLEKCYFQLPKDKSVHKDLHHATSNPVDNLPSKIKNSWKFLNSYS